LAANDRMSIISVCRRRLTAIVKVHRRCFTLTKLKKYSTSALTGIHFPFGNSLHKAYVGTHFLGLWAVSELKFTHMWGDFRIPFGYRIPKEGFINGYTYLLKKVFNGAPLKIFQKVRH